MDQELKDLLERCKAEERSAQTALYRRFASKVYATALRYTDSRDEASDIAQESWIKVFRHLGKFKEFNSFEGWVRRITVNTAITHYRRNLKHRYHDDVTETLATPLDLAASKKADFTMSEIQTAMAALPRGYRTVVQLYLVDGYSHKEIAEMLGVDVNTSKSQLSRGRKQLQAFLAAMSQRAKPQSDLPPNAPQLKNVKVRATIWVKPRYPNVATHKTTTFNDRTMTPTSNNMPPLEATEAPWTDAEMRIQEAMLSSEADAPEALEARVFEALDAAVPESGSASLLRRGALIVASGVAVAALMWPTQEAEVMPASPQQEPAAKVQEALTEPNVMEEIPAVVMDVEVVAEAAAKVDVASQEHGGDLEAVSPSMAPLENLEGLPTAELEGGNHGERFPLKSEKGAPTTERREATLEVKQ